MRDNGTRKPSSLSRRSFGAAAAAAIAASGTARAAAPVMETDVKIKTVDGLADAALFTPASGRWPAVLIWADALGLRPAFREMGRRLAAEGYVVLVPNPFYRSRPAPVFDEHFSFSNPDDRAKAFALVDTLGPETTARDADAFIRFLDQQPQTNLKARAGVHGYCMGGPLAFQAAARRGDRIGALATFHGASLVTAKPDSPHRLIPTIKARAYCGVAANDDQKDPQAKGALRAAFAAAGLGAHVEVYDGCNHGWCVRDNPTYQAAGAERAFGELLNLYRGALV